VRLVPKYYLPIFLIPTLVASTLRTMRWRDLVSPAKKLPFRRALRYQLAGLAMSNLTPARVGEAGKVLLLKKYEGLSVSKTLQSVIWERLLDLVLLLPISLSFLALLVGGLEPRLMILSVAGSLFVILACVLAFVAMRYQKVGFWLLRYVEKIPVVNKHVTKEFLESFYSSAKLSKKLFAKSSILTLLIWGVDSIAFILIFSVLGIEIPLLYLVGGMFLSILIGLVSFLPGGIGSSELSYILILGFFGLDKGVAAAGVLVGRAFTLGFTLIWGMVELAYLMWKEE